MSNPPEALSTGAKENLSKLKEKLRELFQLNRGDLDFGLYRVMAIKSAEVNEFLNERLLPQVTETLGDIARSDISLLEANLEKATSAAQGLGVDPEDTPKVKELKAQIKAAQGDQQTEADTYNHLFNFFSRYYDEGDFMSLRRYKSGGKEAYSIPYNGEEVKLHWANSDQYYIKTTENYSSYVFTFGDGNNERRACFEIAAADNEKDNIKESNDKQRSFVLAKNFIKISANELIIRFDHRPLTEGEKKKHPKNGIKRQHSINQETEQQILAKIKDDKGGWLALIAAPCPTEVDENRTLLGKHLTAYTAKNSFDYFIHKDLGGFLRRELDNYLKSEVISIDNLELSDDPTVFIRNLAQIKAIKNVGNKIIDFLAQLEDFQKDLWLKKKFVLETQYCVTLDNVPESLYAEIAKNKAQRDEWVELFSIDELKCDIVTTAYSNSLKPKFLKENLHLVLDTRHFNQVFKDKLLAALSDAGPIEEQLNGLLVHGENFQALNLLQERYREQVKCVHIDPPYNTQTSEFVYKNGYQHSSWLAMMQDRIHFSLKLLSESGFFICHIDENEYERLHMLFERFPISDAGTVVWDKRNPMTGGGGVAIQHEYIIWRSRTEKAINIGSGHAQLMLNKAKNLIEENNGIVSKEIRQEYANWVKKHPDFSGGEKACQFIDSDGLVYQSVSLRAPEPREDPKFFIPLIHPKTKQLCAIPPNGFSRTPETLQNMIKRGEIIFGKDHTIQPRQKRILSEHLKKQITSVVSDATRGKPDIDSLGLKNFPYNHSVRFYKKLIEAASESFSDTILDYFAGSGTTGHAVINLNREDGGERKYILVELGHHFETVLLPRMKKVTYSKEWKDGKPQGREGISQLFKYVRLESYEDTLDSLTVKLRKGPVEAVENKKFIEDNLLRYALREEIATRALLLGQDFISPFNYTLSVVRDGVRRDAQVDLVETFNFLLGLRLATRRHTEDVLTITGTNAKGEICLILWRNIEKMDASKLDKWFGKHRKTFANDLNLVYANGDHTLNALRESDDKWEAITTEPVFRKLMFGDE